MRKDAVTDLGNGYDCKEINSTLYFNVSKWKKCLELV